MKISELLYLISKNNREAFNRFYHLYYEQVFRFAFYILKEKTACSEVVADVFLSVWKSRNRLADISNIETYLYVATRNESARYAKNNNRKHVHLDEVPMCFELSDQQSPESDLLTNEAEALLNQTIAGLPEKCRLIFLMSRQEGLKSKEIADILSISESTVRVQLKNAVDTIIEKLKPHFPNVLTLSLFLF